MFFYLTHTGSGSGHTTPCSYVSALPPAVRPLPSLAVAYRVGQHDLPSSVTQNKIPLPKYHPLVVFLEGDDEAYVWEIGVRLQSLLERSGYANLTIQGLGPQVADVEEYVRTFRADPRIVIHPYVYSRPYRSFLALPVRPSVCAYLSLHDPQRLADWRAYATREGVRFALFDATDEEHEMIALRIFDLYCATHKSSNVRTAL